MAQPLRDPDGTHRSLGKLTNQVVETRDLAAFASHELRGPLNTMQAFLLIMLQEQPGPLNDVQRDFLGSMLTINRRLQRLANDIRVVIAEGDQLTIHPRAVDVRATADDCVREIAPTAAEFKVSVDAVPDQGSDWSAIIDSDRLSQVLINLLENAVRNSISGSTVSLRLRSSPTRVLLVVENSPISAPEEYELDSWFEPYVRGAGANERAPRGSGLGLAVVAHLVSALGGQIVKRIGPDTVSIGVILVRSMTKISRRDVAPQSK
jgi:signal transduction histidine kinase